MDELNAAANSSNYDKIAELISMKFTPVSDEADSDVALTTEEIKMRIDSHTGSNYALSEIYETLTKLGFTQVCNEEMDFCWIFKKK